MSVLKRYNTNTSQWEVAVVGQQGEAGVVKSSIAPTDTNVIWIDTNEQATPAIPPFGNTGQVLAKASNDSYDSEWVALDISDIQNLQNSLDAKAGTSDLDTKANLSGASFTGDITINDSFLAIDGPGGVDPNFVMQGDGEQTFRFHNTAATGSTRVSWKLANRVNPDWTWIIMSDRPSDGTQDLTFRNRNGDSLYLSAGNQVVGNFVSQILPKSASFTITNNDAGKTINSTGGAIIVTIPDVLLPGDRIDFVQQGTGQITFAGSGITLNAADGRSKTRTQYSVASIICMSAGVYVLGGDIA